MVPVVLLARLGLEWWQEWKQPVVFEPHLVLYFDVTAHLLHSSVSLSSRQTMSVSDARRKKTARSPQVDPIFNLSL